MAIVDGDLLVAGLDARTLQDLPDLEIVTGDIVIAGNPSSCSRSMASGTSARSEAASWCRGTTWRSGMSKDVALGTGARRFDQHHRQQQSSRHSPGLEQLVDLHASLTIANNPVLTSLSGLDHLITSNRSLYIQSNHSLASVSALGKPAIRGVARADRQRFAGRRRPSPCARARRRARRGQLQRCPLARVEFPLLSTTGDFVRIDDNGALGSVDLPAYLTTRGLIVEHDRRSITSVQRTEVGVRHGRRQHRDLAPPHGGPSRSAAIDRRRPPAWQEPPWPTSSGFPMLGSIGGAFMVENNLGLSNLFSGLASLMTVSGHDDRSPGTRSPHAASPG